MWGGKKRCFITKFDIIKEADFAVCMTNTEIEDDSEFQPYRTSGLLESVQYPLTMTNYLKKLWKIMVLKTYVF